jgi:hypothetical protein
MAGTSGPGCHPATRSLDTLRSVGVTRSVCSAAASSGWAMWSAIGWARFSSSSSPTRACWPHLGGRQGRVRQGHGLGQAAAADRQWAAVTAVVVRSPIEVAPVHAEVAGLGHGVDTGHCSRHHLIADPVAGDDVDDVATRSLWSRSSVPVPRFWAATSGGELSRDGEFQRKQARIAAWGRGGMPVTVPSPNEENARLSRHTVWPPGRCADK